MEVLKCKWKVSLPWILNTNEWTRSPKPATVEWLFKFICNLKWQVLILTNAFIIFNIIIRLEQADIEFRDFVATQHPHYYTNPVYQITRLHLNQAYCQQDCVGHISSGKQVVPAAALRATQLCTKIYTYIFFYWNYYLI